MFTVEAVTSPERFASEAVSWNALIARSDINSPFMRSEWFVFFWKNFCGGCQPLVLLVKKGPELVAGVPLVRHKTRWRGLPVVRMGFMANYFSIRCGIACAAPADAELAESIFRFLKGSRIGFDIFEADFVVKDSLTDRTLRGYCLRRGLGCKAMPGDSNPYIPLLGSWDEYLASRSKHQRFNIRHVMRLYERGVKHTVTTYTDCGLDDACEKMFAISRGSWKFRQGTGICNDPAKMNFYRRFLKVAADAGWLGLRILEIEGKPAAFSYELHYGRTVYILKIGFSDEFKKLAPGAFLMYRSIREAFEGGFTECELLGEAEEWKLKICDRCREHVKYWIFNDSPYGKLLRMWEERVVSAAKHFAPKIPSIK